MKKAGNLRHAFARTSGEAVVIFDADFCPRSDFLRETLPYLLDPSIGIVQTPQFFRWCKEQTWVEKGAGASQEFFYRMEQARVPRGEIRWIGLLPKQPVLSFVELLETKNKKAELLAGKYGISPSKYGCVMPGGAAPAKKCRGSLYNLRCFSEYGTRYLT